EPARPPAVRPGGRGRAVRAEPARGVAERSARPRPPRRAGPLSGTAAGKADPAQIADGRRPPALNPPAVKRYLNVAATATDHHPGTVDLGGIDRSSTAHLCG